MIKIPNERKHAEKMLESGFITEYMKLELKILAKYYKNIGIKPKKRKELLYEFCEKNMPYFNKAKFYKTINSTISYSNNKKNTLLEIDYVIIYKYELDYVKSLDISLNLKKVLMSFIILNRMNKVGFGSEGYFKTQNSFSDLKIVSNLKQNVKIFGLLVELENLDLIRICLNGVLELKFLNLIPKIEKTKEYTFVNFNDIGYWFEMMCGNQKIIKCKDCEMLIKKTFNKTIYCKKCSDKKQYYEKLESKKIICDDCGVVVEVSNMDNETTKCKDCYITYRQKYKADKEKERRLRIKEAYVDSTILK